MTNNVGLKSSVGDTSIPRFTISIEHIGDTEYNI